MTREEAIKVLENPDVSIGVSARIGQDPEYWRKLRPALDMAISALRKQETVAKCNGLNEPLTNAQKIRSMSDEEIAESSAFRFCPSKMIGESCTFRNCKECWLEWLQMPAEEDDHA